MGGVLACFPQNTVYLKRLSPHGRVPLCVSLGGVTVVVEGLIA